MSLKEHSEKFIDLYSIEFSKDFMYLSMKSTSTLIAKLLDNGKVVICNLTDRDGVIGLPVKSIVNNHITMRNLTHDLTDNFLYNLIYDVKKNKHFLEVQDEYFEKIIIDK